MIAEQEDVTLALARPAPRSGDRRMAPRAGHARLAAAWLHHRRPAPWTVEMPRARGADEQLAKVSCASSGPPSRRPRRSVGRLAMKMVGVDSTCDLGASRKVVAPVRQHRQRLHAEAHQERTGSAPVAHERASTENRDQDDNRETEATARLVSAKAEFALWTRGEGEGMRATYPTFLITLKSLKPGEHPQRAPYS